MKKIVLIIWAAILVSLVYYLASHFDELKGIGRISFADILLIAALFLTNQYLNSMRLKMLFKKMGLKLGRLECFHLSNITTMANYLPLKGGTLASAVYFKNRHDISYFKFLNISIAGLVFQVFTIAAVSLLSILVYLRISGIFFYQLFYFFSFLLVGLVIFAALLGLVVGKVKTRKIKDGIQELHLLLSDRALLLELFMINIGIIAIMAFRFAIAFKVLNYKASFMLSFLAGQMKSLAVLVNLSPSGLGLAELLAGVMSKMAGGNIAIGIYAASVDRGVSVVVLIVLSILSLVYLKKRHVFNAGKGN